MKKKTTSGRIKRCFISLYLLISVFLVMEGTLSPLYAANNYGSENEQRVATAQTVKEVFSYIEHNSNFVILYSKGILSELGKKVSINMNGKKVEDILKELSSVTGMEYKISDRQITVTPKAPAPQPQNVQQDIRVTGQVFDENGETIPGANVTVKGNSSVGTVTDMDGNFSLNVPKGSVLVVSFIGYTSQECAAKANEKIVIKLEPDTETLDEVVVVAYGTQRKSSITGAIATVKSASLQTVTTPSVTSMLGGKVAGAVVTQTDGKPDGETNITIRGRGSISSTTTPLWVVDGVVGGQASSLNPNDIESISILKDGSATALYGSRGANGVILVTTKNAKLGTNNIDISVKVGATQATKGGFKVMNSSELYAYTEAAFKNSATGEAYSWFTPKLLENDTDWWDIATQTAFSQNYNVAYTTGTEKIKSYLSADYYSEEGTVKGYDYDRFTARSNISYKFNDRLSIRTKVSGSYAKSFSQERSLYAALTYLPWDTPYNSLGEVKTGKEGMDISSGKDMKDYWFGRDSQNYLYDLQTNWSDSKTIAVDGTFGLDYKIIDGLTFESTNSIGFKYTIGDSYTDPNSQSGASSNGSIYNSNTYIRNRYANQLLRYNKIFNNVHDVSAFLGFEYNDQYTKTNSATGEGIPIGGEVLGVATTPARVGGDQYTWKAIGYYFNTNYAYKDTYMLQFSFRHDGSSKFGRNKRFGNFFTVGGGWNMENEAFMQELDFISQLKLRASYGSTGNTPGGAFTHMGLYQINLNYNTLPAAFPYQMVNRNMTWEKAYTTNVGIDAEFFNRLGLSLEFYIKNTSGLLYAMPLSALSGYSTQWVNQGAMKNTGVELTLSPEIIKTKDWNWSVNFNLAYNKNKITELAGGKEQEVSGNTVREVGYALGTYYMKEWAGVNPMDGTPLWIAIEEDGSKKLVGSEAEATLQRLDKRQLPDLTGGIQTNLSYKDFTLGATFTYAGGFYIYHSGRQNYDNDGIEIQYNSMKLKDGWSRWEKPGDIATHPQVKSGGNNLSNAVSSRYLERGDYFKMKSLSLSYNVPSKALKPLGIKSARLSLSCENLFTVTEFSGVDPELGANGAAVGAGYAIPRKYYFGLNLSF